jgi:hypothetical protein
MDEQQQWYVTIAGNAVGPVSTDLVLRGIKHKKIATEAYVCVVGADQWQALTDVPEFHGALREHGLLPEVSSLDVQPELSLAAIAAAQADASQPGSPEAAQSDAMQLVRAGIERLLAPQQESADTLRDADEDDESDATAPFSNRPSMELPPMIAEQSVAPEPAFSNRPAINLPPMIAERPVAPEPAFSNHPSMNLPPMYAEQSEPPEPARDEPSEITHVAELLPSRPAPDVAIHEIEEEPTYYDGPIPGEPRNGKHVDVQLASRPPMHSIDIDVDFSAEEPHVPVIDWNRGFADYFLVDAEVTLPDQDMLLRSLTSTDHETFLNDEAMWNLALCLAFGSNAVASVAADVFFDVVATHEQYDRIEWMTRTLLSRGFMPSGIPHPAGNMGIGRLRQACPPELLMQLESQLGM